MSFIKIKIKENDTLAKVLNVFPFVTEKKIIFLCSRNVAFLSEISNLKKVKHAIEAGEKKIVFVVAQKFLKELLHSQGFEVHADLPAEFAEGEVRELASFFDEAKAKKNETSLHSKVSDREKEKKGLPQFATRAIEGSLESKNIRGKIFFVLLVVVGLLVGILYWVSPKATIIFKPKISAVPIMQNVLITFPDSKISDQDKTLPQVHGILVQNEIVGPQTIQASGRLYEVTNAKGKVTLFNETDQSKYLVPSRLSTVDGVIFRFKHDVTIPPRQGKDPGQVVVEVEADQMDGSKEPVPIGYRGNIDAGTDLFFPGLKKEARELYYARANKGPLVGGSTLTHYIVEPEDVQKGQDLLKEAFRVQAMESLNKEILDRSTREKRRYVLLDNLDLVQTTLSDYVFPVEAIGKESQTIQVTGKVNVAAVVFDQTEVIDIMKEKLKMNLDHRQKLIEIDPKSVEYRILESDNFAESKRIKLSVNMVGVETLDIDSESRVAQEWQNSLKKEIAGKSLEEARSILTNLPEIDNVIDFKVSPPWAQALPGIYDRINFEIRAE